MLEAQAHPLPVRASQQPDGLYLALRDIAPEQLRDAFMQETVARVAAVESFVQIERADLGKAAAGSAPAGLIFHVARCGSTLVSQLLKQHPGLVVYSEPLPINEILLPPHRFPRAEIVAALRSLGAAFAQHARKPYVLKLSSWNTLFCDIVAEAFPETPWVLSVRDPIEVGVSLVERPAGWIQGNFGAAAQLRRHVDPESLSRSPEDFIARLFGAFCDAAAQLDATRGRLVPYETLPAAVWESVAPHFALALDATQRSRMIEAARANAKDPVGKATEFSGDAAQKQAAASLALREAVDALARPSLAALERLHALSD